MSIYETQLASIAIENVNRTAGLAISANPALESISLPSLATIYEEDGTYGSLSIGQNSALTSISLDNLGWISKGLYIKHNQALPSFSLDRLHTFGGTESASLFGVSFAIEGNAALTSFSLEGLEDSEAIRSLTISGNDSLCQTLVDAFFTALTSAGMGSLSWEDLFDNDDSC